MKKILSFTSCHSLLFSICVMNEESKPTNHHSHEEKWKSKHKQDNSCLVIDKSARCIGARFIFINGVDIPSMALKCKSQENYRWTKKQRGGNQKATDTQVDFLVTSHFQISFIQAFCSSSNPSRIWSVPRL